MTPQTPATVGAGPRFLNNFADSRERLATPFFPPADVSAHDIQADVDLVYRAARGARITQADLIDHARFVADYERRMAAIYNATASERPAMTQQLRKEMANVR